MLISSDVSYWWSWISRRATRSAFSDARARRSRQQTSAGRSTTNGTLLPFCSTTLHDVMMTPVAAHELMTSTPVLGHCSRQPQCKPMTSTQMSVVTPRLVGLLNCHHHRQREMMTSKFIQHRMVTWSRILVVKMAVVSRTRRSCGTVCLSSSLVLRQRTAGAVPGCSSTTDFAPPTTTSLPTPTNRTDPLT